MQPKTKGKQKGVYRKRHVLINHRNQYKPRL